MDLFSDTQQRHARITRIGINNIKTEYFQLWIYLYSRFVAHLVITDDDSAPGRLFRRLLQ